MNNEAVKQPSPAPHQADAWIEQQWLGKPAMQVKRIEGVSGVPDLVGRCGNVAEVFWDEKGALHCLVSAPEGCWWAPASLLALDFLEPKHCCSVSASGYQCTRPQDHDPALAHYARGEQWEGDCTGARKEKRPNEAVVKHPAPFEGFMRADNPHLGGGFGP